MPSPCDTRGPIRASRMVGFRIKATIYAARAKGRAASRASAGIAATTRGADLPALGTAEGSTVFRSPFGLGDPPAAETHGGFRPAARVARNFSP